ncbi:HlyD family efflux transporter periplasmic adaptor subunit [Desulfosporosinus fructosivorans]|uniref:HlyD family efflux transporter periplasmic adaptor subunit n=1 Tax=Desulfosporosinus fructosivorans TaxID=2018669 RepID=A0A4Z0QVD2_9FIRM|nr:HlyD family efflux transporter periplasmic adaptor subunit [Desulfosporosinus fructosivorans]TGE34771.1 HlyD family efflux transporter periplasmic adaptor subunit [Desulfosporosinus fructosivorans]
MMKNIMTNKKKVVIVSVILAAVLAAVYFGISLSGNKGVKVSGYTTLSKKDLINSISASGTFESINSRNVYSTLNYPVKIINAKLGEKVTAGETLAILDTSTLALDIEQQRSVLLNSETNSELADSQANLQSAEIELENKKKSYEIDKVLFDAGAVSQNDLDKAETDYKTAQINYDKLFSAYNSTKIKANQDLNTNKIALQKLEKDLADSVIKAPITGTVTSIYAVVGAIENGLLFVVEDTDNLKVTTNVKEYDMGKVNPEQIVYIKSDATGDKIINGRIVSISPSSTKDAAGKSNTSSNVIFETRVDVIDKNPGLKIGMNARLNIILDKKSNVYAVPYEAITKNSNNQDVVYAIASVNGKKMVKELIVSTGLETDLYTEISGEELTDGTEIINDVTGVKDGDIVDLQTVTQ